MVWGKGEWRDWGSGGDDGDGERRRELRDEEKRRESEKPLIRIGDLMLKKKKIEREIVYTIRKSSSATD